MSERTLMSKTRTLKIAICCAALALDGCARRNTVSAASAEKPATSHTASTPRVWLSSLKIMALFRTDDEGKPLVKKWDFVREHIDGIKFWDGQIDHKTVDELRDIFAVCRKNGIRIAYEKGRWPLPEDLFEMAVAKRMGRERSRQAEKNLTDAELRRAAVAHILSDQGPALSSYDAAEFAVAAAGPEITRLKKIRDAGGIDLMEFIDLDGGILKNVFPYAFAHTQWKLGNIPEEKYYQRGFKTPADFLRGFLEMMSVIRREVPEACHVRFRHLPNVHFWRYKQPVVTEKRPDGTMIYHNVDFKRFAEHTLDYHDVLPLLRQHQDIIYGVTTDYPHELFVRRPGNARYRAIARDAMAQGFSFCPILNVMAAKESMATYHQRALAYCGALRKHVKPDMYLVQSWGKHPTWEDIFKSEDEPGCFLNLAKEVIMRVKTLPFQATGARLP